MDIMEEKQRVAYAMVVYGGDFCKHLGEALYAADSENTQKIHDTWPEDWARFLEMGRTKEPAVGEITASMRIKQMRACTKEAKKNGHTAEEAKNCDDCSLECPECPFVTK